MHACLDATHGIPAGEQEDAGGRPRHAAPGPGKNLGVVGYLRAVVLGELVEIDGVAKVRTGHNVLDAKAVRQRAPGVGQVGDEKVKAVVCQQGLAGAFGSGNDAVAAGEQLFKICV